LEFPLALASAVRTVPSSPDEDLIAWAEMHLTDALADIAALKTSTRIWRHRQGQDPIDITEAELARLERRVRRLERWIERKRMTLS
jgi:hypothetical protein